MRIIRLCAAVLLSLVAASPALAITFGEPDGNDHPTVAAIIVDFDDIPYPAGRATTSGAPRR
jgi:hypothetical protein